MDHPQFARLATQPFKSGLPPMHPNQADKQSASDIGSEQATIDLRAKNNSRFGNRLNKFMDSGDILGEQDPADGHTQQTNDAIYEVNDFPEDSDQYMVTKFRSSQVRQFKASQNNSQVSGKSGTINAESSGQDGKDYENFQKVQVATFGRSGTEKFRATESIGHAIETSSQNNQHSMELHAESHIMHASSIGDHPNEAQYSTEQITTKPLQARSIHNVSSARGDLPMHELENEKSLGTNLALINPKIMQDATVKRVDTFSALTQSNGSSDLKHINDPPSIINDRRPSSIPDYGMRPTDLQRLSHSALDLNKNENFEIQIASGEIQMISHNHSQLDEAADYDEIHRDNFAEQADGLLTKSEEEFAEELGHHIRAESQHSNELIYFGHQGKKGSAEKPVQPLTDQMIFSRLPQNYFIQDEEPEDVYAAQSQLQNMRQGFFSYVHETQAPPDLQDALDPTRFIRKHFGAEGVQDPDFLFKEIITEIPQPVQESPKEAAQMITGEILLKGSRNFDSFNEQFALSTKEDRKDSYPANILIPDKRTPSSQYFKVGLSKGSPLQQQVPDSGLTNQQTSSFEAYSSAQRDQTIECARSNQDSTKSGNQKRRGQKRQTEGAISRDQINNLRIADYFTPGMSSHHSQGVIMAVSEDTAEKIIEKWRQPKSLRKNAIQSNHTTLTALQSQNDSAINSSLQRLVESQEEARKQREQFEAKLEKDVLDNVDTNFIFNQGVNLATGLIDLDRLYIVMNKLKELAYKQITSGSKEIDYQEIVRFIQQENCFFAECSSKNKASIFDANKQTATIETRDELSGILTEPPHPDMINKNEENQRRWNMCLQFLRNNPKLLMQMIPDVSDDEEEAPRHTIDGNSLYNAKPQAKIIPKGRLHLKLDEAKKWQEGKSRKSAKGQQKNLFQPYSQIRPSKLKQARNVQSSNSQERRELCTSGDPRKSLKPRQLQPLTSKNYPNGELSFVTRSGLNAQQAEEPEPSQRVRSGSQRNESGSRRESAYDAYKVSKRVKGQRGQSSHGIRPKRSPIRPQTGTMAKSPLQLSEQNYQAGDFLRGFESQKISVNMDKHKNNGLMSYMSGSRQNDEVKTFQNTNDKLSLNSGAPLQKNMNIVKRPITAGVNRSLVSKKRSRERLASNKVLQEHAQTRHSLRQYLFARGASAKTGLRILSSSGAVLSSQSQQSPRRLQNNDSSAYITSFEQTTVQGNRIRVTQSGARTTQFKQSQLSKNSQNTRISQNKDSQPGSLVDMENDYKLPIQQEETYHAKFETVDATPIVARNAQLAQDAIYETEKRLACEPQIQQITGQIISDEVTIQRKVYVPNRASQSSLSATLKQADYSQLQIRDNNRSPYEADSTLLRGLPNIEETLQNSNNAEVQSDVVKLSGGAMSSQSIYQVVKNLPSVDWAYTPLCVQFLRGELSFNSADESRYFLEAEIDYVIDMIKDRFQEFKKTETMLPFYTKAFETLQALLLEQQMVAMFSKFSKMYSEVTIENTLKLLLRCKLAFQSRQILIDIFNAIEKYQTSVKEVQVLLDRQTAYKLEIEELANMRLMAGRMREAGNNVFYHIKLLQADKKSTYNQGFIYKKQDLIMVIKSEINEIHQLIDVLRPKRRPDSPDSEKRGRYTAGFEDVPSSSSQSTQKEDSTNLNQATEFHWEPTSSMAREEREQQRQDRYLQKQRQKWSEQIKPVENEHFSRKWYKQKKDW